MLDRKIINDLLEIKEAYEMPNKLMEILSDKEARETLFENFLKHENDLSYDWFTDYFQTEQGDREILKQDFTPKCVCEIINRLEEPVETVTDICSGTGGLFIKEWTMNQEAFFHCEEISSRTIPILLFNMAIRGINGELVHGDALEKDIYAIYYLEKKGKFSDITKIETVKQTKAKKIISNPPYSLSWNIINKQVDMRFREYSLAPKSKADYAFILHSLYQLENNGVLLAILPHGVLFRSSNEGNIRKQLIEENKIDAVIGLPDKLFLNTQIPVIIFVLRKNKKTKDILFIDASKEFILGKKQNNMSEENINKIIEAYKSRKMIDKFSYAADIEEIRRNDYNLNIPRYVDTFEPEPVPDLYESMKELRELDKELKENEISLYYKMTEILGTNKQDDLEHKKAVREFKEMLEEKYKEVLQ